MQKPQTMSEIKSARASDRKDAPDYASDGAKGVDAAHGWERPSVTFRLTEERRRALLQLAPELGLRASPTAAIDFAIERAAGMGVASTRLDSEGSAGWGHDAVEELRAVLAACAALRDDGAQTRASVERLERQLAQHGVSDSTTSLTPEERSSANDMTLRSTTLGTWLDREAGAGFSWAVVKARWIDAWPTDAGKAMARFEAWGAAPMELARQIGVTELVEAGPLRLRALAAFEDSVGVMVCSRSTRGWTAKVHALDGQGKLGPELDCFVA
jgi:hypothetical protein